MELIEHLFDTDHFLDEVYRVLKPNGIFVLSTPNLASIHNRIALLLGYQPYCMSVSIRHLVGYLKFSHKIDVSAHIRFFTLKSLTQLLLQHNFKIVEKQGAGVISSLDKRYPKYLYLIDKVFSKFPSLAYTLIVKTEKVL